MRKNGYKIVERNKQGAIDMGVQFYEIDKTPFIEACKPQQEAFCAQERGQCPLLCRLPELSEVRRTPNMRKVIDKIIEILCTLIMGYMVLMSAGWSLRVLCLRIRPP